MIQKGTYVRVLDNSGANLAFCLGFVKSTNRYASIGDVILVSIKSLRENRKSFSKVKKKEILQAVILRCKKKKKFLYNSNLWFLENGVALMTLKKKCIASRIFGLSPKYFFRSSTFSKILTISDGTTV